MNEKRLKYLLNYINKRNCEVSTVKNEFDTLVEEYFGFHYSDKDIDYIIDKVDYGLGYLEFNEFKNVMESEKNKFPNNFVSQKDGKSK